MGGLLDLMAQLDLIDKVDALVGDVINRGDVKVFHVVRWMDQNGGWSGGTIEQMLKRHGVGIWGRGFTPDTLCFHVKNRQAGWAEYLMLRAGIAVVSQAVDEHNITWAEKWPTGEVPMWGEGVKAQAHKAIQPTQKRHKKRKPSRAVSAGKGIAQALRRAVKAVAGEQ